MTGATFIYGPEVCQGARADGSAALVCTRHRRVGPQGGSFSQFAGRRLGRPGEEGLWLYCRTCNTEHCFHWSQVARSMVGFIGLPATLTLLPSPEAGRR